jgi:hypothetical protein
MWRGKKSLSIFWLMLMFYGGAFFGLIDHLWNNELFLVSKEWGRDLALGAVITAGIILAWRIVLALAKRTPALSAYLTVDAR